MRIKTKFMDKQQEITKEKTLVEKAKDSFLTALMSAGILLAVLLLLWIPFKVIPFMFGNGSNFVSTTLSSLFVPGQLAPSQSSSTTDSNNNKPVSTNVSTNTGTGTTYSNLQTQKVYYGKPDLQVTLVSTGIIDPASKEFVQTNYAGFNDEVAIKFEVKNIGTNVTGAWKLRINAPSRTTPYYDSESQPSMKPGDRIVYTTTFNSPLATGINTAYITIDPLNEIQESSEVNNLLTVPIKVDGTYYTYNNNYNYGSNAPVPNLPYGSLYTWTNMNVNCYANPQTSYMGSTVNWYATVSGGSGYYTYAWTGSDLLNANTSAINKIYYSSGTKMASVTVTSNGQSLTAQCSVNIY